MTAAIMLATSPASMSIFVISEPIARETTRATEVPGDYAATDGGDRFVTDSGDNITRNI